MTPTERQEARSNMVDMSDRAADEPLDASTLIVVFPALGPMSIASRDAYLRLRERYAAEGPSDALTIEVLKTAGDLGTLLQALRRIDGSIVAIARRRPKLAPPLPVFDEIYASLVMLTGDDPDTLTRVIGPDELEAMFSLTVTDRWLPELERWLASMAERHSELL